MLFLRLACVSLVVEMLIEEVAASDRWSCWGLEIVGGGDIYNGN